LVAVAVDEERKSGSFFGESSIKNIFYLHLSEVFGFCSSSAFLYEDWKRVGEKEGRLEKVEPTLPWHHPIRIGSVPLMKEGGTTSSTPFRIKKKTPFPLSLVACWPFPAEGDSILSNKWIHFALEEDSSIIKFPREGSLI